MQVTMRFIDKGELVFGEANSIVTVESSPFIFGENEPWIDIATGQTKTNSDHEIQVFKLQLHKEKGTVRLVPMVRKRELPADALGPQ